MSSQPTNNLNSTSLETSPDLSCPVATDAQDAERQSRTVWYEKLGPDSMSLIFELCVYPPGWEKEWDTKLSQQPWDERPQDRDRYPKDRPFNSPKNRLALRQVCRKWENMVQSMPELWNKHFMVINAKENQYKAARRANHAYYCLQRCPNSPLTLYMACYQDDEANTGGKSVLVHAPHRFFMHIITSPAYASRWSRLFIRGNCEGLFKICGRDSMVAPSLFKLFLVETHDQQLPDPQKNIMNIKWSIVTHLHMQVPSLEKYGCISEILNKAPQLLSLQVGIFREYRIQVYTARSPRRPIIHPRLKSFRMYGNVGDSDFVFFEKVEFPGLTELHVSFFNPFKIEPLSSKINRPDILQHFINRSRLSTSFKLKRLDLIGVSSVHTKLIKIIKQIPSLEILHITSIISNPTHTRELSILGELLSSLLFSILDATNGYLPNIRVLSYLVHRNPRLQRGNVEFIFAQIPRRPLRLDIPLAIGTQSSNQHLTSSDHLNRNCNLRGDAEPDISSLPSKVNLLADKNLFGEERVSFFQGVKYDEIALYINELPDSDHSFMRSIELHEQIQRTKLKSLAAAVPESYTRFDCGRDAGSEDGDDGSNEDGGEDGSKDGKVGEDDGEAGDSEDSSEDGSEDGSGDGSEDGCKDGGVGEDGGENDGENQDGKDDGNEDGSEDGRGDDGSKDGCEDGGGGENGGENINGGEDDGSEDSSEDSDEDGSEEDGSEDGSEDSSETD